MSRRSSKRRAFLRERAVFVSLSPAICALHGDRWVGILRGRLADADDDLEALRARTWRRARGRSFFIGKLGREPPVLDMPGFELEGMAGESH